MGLSGFTFLVSSCSGDSFSSSGAAAGDGGALGQAGYPVNGPEGGEDPGAAGAGASSGAASGTAGATGGEGSPPGGEGGGPGVGSCRDEVAPDDALFVSQELGNDSAPGTSKQPLATLGAALSKAVDRVIVVGWGEYAEPPLHVPAGAQVIVRGGYAATAAGRWRRSCGDFPTRSKIVLSEGVGLTSEGHLTLDSVAFEQRAPQGKTGRSSIAIFAGEGSFQAVNVAIAAAPGGPGADVPGGAPGAPGTLRLSDCSDGQEGAPGQPGTEQSPWSCNAAGCVAGAGEDGKVGGKGAAGVPGQGAFSRTDCVSCNCDNACVPTSNTVSVGAATCGEGGGPGGPGKGGLGGGASIALFLGPGVLATLEEVTLTAHQGGGGSRGGDGGLGGDGANGAAGQNSGACCREGCAKEGTGECGSGGCYVTPYLGNGVVGTCPANRVVSSAAGGKGGRGGAGGRGADGPPGPSFALVRSAGDDVDLSRSVSLFFATDIPDPNNAGEYLY